MGVFEKICTEFPRIWRACVIFKHAAICLSRSFSRIFRFSATDTQIFLDVYLQQSFEEAA
jgi:hypothetical protein